MLNIYIPPYYSNEIRWVLSVLLENILGVAYRVIVGNKDIFTLQYDGKTLRITDDFFSKSNDFWLKSSTLPKVPMVMFNVQMSGLKIVINPLQIIIQFGQCKCHSMYMFPKLSSFLSYDSGTIIYHWTVE